MKLHWDTSRETITLHPETINERGRCEILMRMGWHVGFGREPSGELIHVTFAIKTHAEPPLTWKQAREVVLATYPGAYLHHAKGGDFNGMCWVELSAGVPLDKGVSPFAEDAWIAAANHILDNEQEPTP